jgi:hypothetical protein
MSKFNIFKINIELDCDENLDCEGYTLLMAC